MTKVVMKVTETTANVKIVGTGTEVINLATDLIAPTQILDGTVRVGIMFIQWTAGTSITISRGIEPIYELFGATGIFDLSGYNGMLDVQNQSDNITVNIAGGGSVLINLRKISGYTSRIEPWAFGQYDNPNVVGS